MTTATTTGQARMQLSPPKRFRAGAMLAVYAYGAIAALPLMLAFLVVSLRGLGVQSFLLPAAALALTIWFLPLVFGNRYIARLVRSMAPPAAGEKAFVVQMTMAPRLRSGLRAVFEDADDFGCLRCAGAGLEFEGDSVKLSVPAGRIQEVRPRNIGLLGLFVYGMRVTVTVSGLPGVTSLEFAERLSWSLPASRRISRQLLQAVSQSRAEGRTHTGP